MSHGTISGKKHAVGADDTIDHITGMLDRVYDQFNGSPNIQDVATFMAEQLQQTEELIHDLAWFVFAGKAAGKVLDDLIGNWGRTRAGLDDAQLQALLHVLHAAQLQRSTGDTVLRVALGIFEDYNGTIHYLEDPPAGFIIRVEGIDSAVVNKLNPFVRLAKGDGVRMQTHVEPDTTKSFKYDTVGRGYDQGNAYSYTL